VIIVYNNSNNNNNNNNNSNNNNSNNILTIATSATTTTTTATTATTTTTTTITTTFSRRARKLKAVQVQQWKLCIIVQTLITILRKVFTPQYIREEATAAHCVTLVSRWINRSALCNRSEITAQHEGTVEAATLTVGMGTRKLWCRCGNCGVAVGTLIVTARHKGTVKVATLKGQSLWET
jgi:hypothetical protein